MIPWDDNATAQALLVRLAESFAAPDRITPSQWAEQRRSMSPESSAKRGGGFTFDLAPWQREPLDAIDDPAVGSIVLLWASQTAGKTETLNNMIGHKIQVDPCPILMLQPTLEMAETYSKDRLVPMIRDTATLRGLVKDPRSRDSGNTMLNKRFPGGHITIAGANSPASLASRPIRIVFFDEVDRYPESAGTEGDPIALAEKRTESFSDSITIKTSTPTQKGRSRIEKEFAASDKRYWFCPCPKCGHSQNLVWEMVKWQEEDPRVNWMECRECHEQITDQDRIAMVRAGQWRATAPFNGVRGYHMNGLYCLFRPRRSYPDRLTQMVLQHLDAKKKGTETLKVWRNTFLAETWEADTERVEMSSVMRRRETWGIKLPGPVCLLTCAVDVQADRLEAEIVGWGAGDESWGIERFVVYGNPLRPDVWLDLDKVRVRKYETQSGQFLTPAITGIDSGGNVDGYGFASSVYRFVMARKQASRGQSGVIALKGSSSMGVPLAVERRQKNGVNLLIVGTDSAKSMLLERLKLEAPGPGFMHFPVTYNEDFFDQLSAEECCTENGRRAWVKVRDKNEALDLRVYSLALVDLLSPNYVALGRIVGVTSTTTTKIVSSTGETIKNPEQPKHEPRPRRPMIRRAPRLFR